MQSIDHIEDFETIAYEDQMEIMKNIDENFKYDEIAGKRGKVADRPNALKNFGVESMAIDRGSCSSCKEIFKTGDVIVMRVVYDSRTALLHGRDVEWDHLKCFAENREVFLYRTAGSLLPGFRQLDTNDQASVRKLLP